MESGSNYEENIEKPNKTKYDLRHPKKAGVLEEDLQLVLALLNPCKRALQVQVHRRSRDRGYELALKSFFLIDLDQISWHGVVHAGLQHLLALFKNCYFFSLSLDQILNDIGKLPLPKQQAPGSSGQSRSFPGAPPP